MRRTVLLMIVAASLFLLATHPLSAAWQDGPANPVFSSPDGAYYPSVLYDAGNFSGHGAAYPYKMWYSVGAATAVGLAGSYDGLRWVTSLVGDRAHRGAPCSGPL